MQGGRWRWSVAVAAILAIMTGARADDAIPSSAGTRYGLFGWLDRRSAYGQGVYPEPFIVDDSDLEVNEARLDWLFTQASSRERDHVVTAEIEKGFGLLTLEIEVPYEVDRDIVANKTTDGQADERARQRLEWDLRVFDDRRRTIGYVCESPLLIEQRIGAIARAVQQTL